MIWLHGFCMGLCFWVIVACGALLAGDFGLV
jgi:hypothetical protein